MPHARLVPHFNAVVRFGAIALCLIPAAAAGAPDKAQQQAIDDLKGKIFDARMAQKTFADGLKYCKELDGNRFYFPPRNRVLTLEEYHRGLVSLAKQQAFNPEKRRPWTEQDAADRWEQAQKEAAADKAKSVKLDDLSKALHAMTVQTVVGPLTWDKKGDVTDPKYVFYIWKNGTYAEL